jgi:chromosome segregation ATPase
MNAEVKEGDRGALSPKGEASDPRLPWEVSPGRGRRPGGAARPEPDRKASRFAEAGIIDVLARIAELRREMHTVYRERTILRRRVAELEEECSTLKGRPGDSKERSASPDGKQAGWDKERQGLLEQALELQDRCQAAESERDSALSELEIARTTIREITQALKWRDEERLKGMNRKSPDE